MICAFGNHQEIPNNLVESELDLIIHDQRPQFIQALQASISRDQAGNEPALAIMLHQPGHASHASDQPDQGRQAWVMLRKLHHTSSRTVSSRSINVHQIILQPLILHSSA